MGQDAENPQPQKSLLSARVFRYPEDLDILNETEDVYFQIWDMTPGEQRAVWGNNSWLNLNGLSLEALQNYNLRDCSQAVKDWQLNLYRKIQLDHLDDVSIKTIYPSAQGGKPVTLKLTMRPMRLKFPDAEEERIVIVSSGVAVEKDKDDFVRAQEMLRYTQAVQVIITHETSAVVFGNLKAQLSYPQVFNAKEESARKDGLKKILDTCAWSEEERKIAEAQISQLTLQSASFEFESLKQSDSCEQDVWHRFVFTPCTDPVTGSFSLSLCEYDVSETKFEQRANKAKDDFLAVISHELRTPLNGIIGLSDALSELPECPPAMKQSLDLICSSGHRLTGLVNDILDSASARQNSLSLVFKPTQVAECCRSVCSVLSVTCKPGVSIRNHVGDLPEIRADAGRISQVLMNLVSNAVKFTPAGEIALSAAVRPPFLRVEVRDAGIGIPEEKMDEIWGAFRQVDMSSTRKYEGTGLGLSLVRSLVEAHGGEVGVQSVFGGPDSGSTFYFTLPLEQIADSSTSNLQSPLRDVNWNCSPPLSRTVTASSECQQREKAEVACQTEPDARAQGKKLLLQELSAEMKKHDQGGAETRCDGEKEHGRTPSRGRSKEGGLAGRAGREGRGGREGGRGGREGEREGGRGRKRREAQEVVSAHSQHHSQLHGQVEIMSVDDSALNHAVIEATFAPKGFKVTKCFGGREALLLLEQRGYLPDVMLLDVMMPDLDGYQLCAQLRRTYPCNTLPVIMVSAKDKHTDILKGLESGCNDYVSKPFHNSELSARIGVQLKLKSLWNEEIQSLVESLSINTDGSDASSASTSPQRGEETLTDQIGAEMHASPSATADHRAPWDLGSHGAMNDFEKACARQEDGANVAQAQTRPTEAPHTSSAASHTCDVQHAASSAHTASAAARCQGSQLPSLDMGSHPVDYVLEHLPADVTSRLPNGHVVVWVGAGQRRPSTDA